MAVVFFTLAVATYSRTLAFVPSKVGILVQAERRFGCSYYFKNGRKCISRNFASSDQIPDSPRQSVSGTIYSSDERDAPVVKLFTKHGCTLCDKVSEVLQSLRDDLPHTLEAVDITDEQNAEFFSKYKWDIPVLWIGDKYWTKHRIDEVEARKGLNDAQRNCFEAKPGEPDSSNYD